MQRRRDKTLVDDMINAEPPQMISSFVRFCFVNFILYRIKLSFIFILVCTQRTQEEDWRL